VFKCQKVYISSFKYNLKLLGLLQFGIGLSALLIEHEHLSHSLVNFILTHIAASSVQISHTKFVVLPHLIIKAEKKYSLNIYFDILSTFQNN